MILSPTNPPKITTFIPLNPAPQKQEMRVTRVAILDWRANDEAAVTNAWS
ncbi:MAG: hypothetical protein AAFZ52_10955 [Bacteroidota bacterium]